MTKVQLSLKFNLVIYPIKSSEFLVAFRQSIVSFAPANHPPTHPDGQTHAPNNPLYSKLSFIGTCSRSSYTPIPRFFIFIFFALAVDL